MLARQHRFQGSRDIQRLYKTGTGVRTKSLGLRYRNQPGQPFRAVVVVSRKVHKSAVVRNRIRRRLYEQLRKEHGASLGHGQLIISVFDASLATTPSPKLARELSHLLSKAQDSGRPKTNHGIVENTGE